MSLKQYGKVPWGFQAIDWQERVNMPRLREERAARTRARMKEHGYAVMLLSNGYNMRYATAIHAGLGMEMAPGLGGQAIAFADYATADMIYYFTDANLTKQGRFHCPWIKPENLRTIHHINPSAGREAVKAHARERARLIVQALKEKGVEKEQIAYDAAVPPVMAALESEGVKLVAAPEVMEEARIIKTMDEINCMRMGGVIADIGWRALFENLKPAIRECELGSKIAAAIFENQQANNPIISLRSGPNTAPNWLSHSPQDRVIEPGDLLFCDMINCGYSGYNTCYYRTFKCGTRPTQKEKDMYQQVYDWLYTAAAEVKPGKTTADVAKKLPPASHWGYKEEWETWSNALGHGHGLASHEPPDITRCTSLDFPQPIEEGMVIAMETWTGEEGVGGVRIENVGVVTASGWENLYQWPDEEITVPMHQLIFGY